jgi:hypothetical protein
VSDLGYEQEDDDLDSSNPLRGARDFGKRMEKKVRDLEKQLDAANARIAGYERKEKQAGQISELAKSGLNEKHAKLFLAINPEVEDITPDAVKAFMDEYGLAVASENGQEQEETTTATTESDIGFTPAAVPGTTSPRPSQKVYTRDEFLKLQERDPAQANIVLYEGRVQMETKL